MTNRPNFLFLLSDQQRWDTIGAGRPALPRTPNMDALAAGGCLFENAYCQGPVCIPSRASFLTGKYIHQHRLFHNNGELPRHETTWGDVLHENGYQTMSVGRTHGIHKGFEHVAVPIGESYLDFCEHHYRSGGFLYNHDQCAVHPGPAEEHVDVRRAETASRCLRDLKDRGAPFALFVGFCVPHNPYLLPEPYASMYAPEEVPAPRIGEGDFTLPDFGPGQQDFFDRMTPEKVRDCTRYYYGMVSLLDDCVGRLLQSLEALGLAEDTVVVLTSDHGEMLGDHARWAKSVIFEESVKIPFVVSNPARIPGGRTSPALIESVDLFPTILDYAGIELRDAAYRLRGRSLRPLLEGTAERVKDAVFSQLPHWIMIRDGRYKLGYGYPEGDALTGGPHAYRGVLFDLEADPGETVNLFDDPAHRATADALLRRLLDFHLDVKIPLHKDVPEIAFEYMPSVPLCVM